MKKTVVLLLALGLLLLWGCQKEEALQPLNEEWLAEDHADLSVNRFEFHVQGDITLATVRWAEGETEKCLLWEPEKREVTTTETMYPKGIPEGCLTVHQIPALLNAAHQWVNEVLPEIRDDYWPAYLRTATLDSYPMLENAVSASYSLSTGTLTKLEETPVFDKTVLGALTVATPTAGMLGQVIIVE